MRVDALSAKSSKRTRSLILARTVGIKLGTQCFAIWWLLVGRCYGVNGVFERSGTAQTPDSLRCPLHRRGAPVSGLADVISSIAGAIDLFHLMLAVLVA